MGVLLRSVTKVSSQFMTPLLRQGGSLLFQRTSPNKNLEMERTLRLNPHCTLSLSVESHARLGLHDRHGVGQLQLDGRRVHHRRHRRQVLNHGGAFTRDVHRGLRYGQPKWPVA